MSKLKKPIIWEGDNDMMIPYQGVAMNGQEISLNEDIADEFAATNKGRQLDASEQQNSLAWGRYTEEKAKEQQGQGARNASDNANDNASSGAGNNTGGNSEPVIDGGE